MFITYVIVFFIPFSADLFFLVLRFIGRALVSLTGRYFLFLRSFILLWRDHFSAFRFVSFLPSALNFFASKNCCYLEWIFHNEAFSSYFLTPPWSNIPSQNYIKNTRLFTHIFKKNRYINWKSNFHLERSHER